MESRATGVTTGDAREQARAAYGAGNESREPVQVGVPIVVALAALAVLVAAVLAIAIAAGWRPF